VADEEEGPAFAHVMDLVRRLRAPGGCPWDRAQTHASLRRFALEEAREVVAAIDGAGQDGAALREELGDLLLQVCLHAAIAAEAGTFTVGDVLDGLAAKLLRRHPHVFGDEGPAADAQEVERRWSEIKRLEREGDGGGAGRSAPPPAAPDPWPSWLEAVPADLPALAEAGDLASAAARCGLTWDSAAAAWPKVEEERAEFLDAWRARGESAAPDGAGSGSPRPPAAAHSDGPGAAQRMEEELGDMLFAVASVARLLGLDAEVALLRANRKFRRRCGAVASQFPGGREEMLAAGAERLDAAWREVKEVERAAWRGGPPPA
jgi:MazG family protein